MKTQLKETPSQLLSKTVESDLVKIAQDLGAKEIDFLDEGIRFKHNGYTCDLICKAKK